MFVALAVERLGEVQRLLPCTELDLDGPTRPVYRDQLVRSCPLLFQVREHQVPSVANQAFRAGFLAGFTGFLVTLGATGRGHFRGRADRDEPALLALLSDDHPEVVDGMTADLEKLLQRIAVFQQHAGGQRQPGQPPGPASLDGGELAEAEVPHIS